MNRIEENTVINFVRPGAPLGAAGILVRDFAAPVVRFNDIAGNAQAGLRATTSATIDARCNWWGAADGPSGNGSGSGDAIWGPLTFVPFASVPVNDQPKDPDRRACQRLAGDID